MKSVPFRPVSSTAVAGFGYLASQQWLFIQYHSDAPKKQCWRYHVTPDQASAFMAAASFGKAAAVIKQCATDAQWVSIDDALQAIAFATRRSGAALPTLNLDPHYAWSLF